MLPSTGSGSISIATLLLLLPSWAAALEPAAPALSLGPGYVARVVLGLAIVVISIAVTAWVVRRFFRVHPSAYGQLRVLSGISVGPRERVVLLQAGETQLLLGVAPGRIQTLCVLEQPIAIATKEDASASPFSLQLNAALKGITSPSGSHA